MLLDTHTDLEIFWQLTSQKDRLSNTINNLSVVQFFETSIVPTCFNINITQDKGNFTTMEITTEINLTPS